MHLKCIWEPSNAFRMHCWTLECIWNAFGILKCILNASGRSQMHCKCMIFLRCILNAFHNAFDMHYASQMHLKCIWDPRNAFRMHWGFSNAFEMHLRISNAFQMHLREIMHLECIAECVLNASGHNNAFTMHWRNHAYEHNAFPPNALWP